MLADATIEVDEIVLNVFSDTAKWDCLPWRVNFLSLSFIDSETLMMLHRGIGIWS